MDSIIWFSIWIIGLGAIAYHRVSLIASGISIFVGLIVSLALGGITWISFAIFGMFSTAVIFMLYNAELRRQYLIAPLLKKLKSSLPTISDTEKIALDAGTVWWDADLFSGKPDWNKFLATPPAKLSTAEREFINGPVETLCQMINDWQINHDLKDLPTEIWDYLKKEKFFGLIIPKTYSGLEFSALAHSEILAKIAGQSTTVASTVSVPNSLGPAELLLHYGTEKQKQYYLPKLATGEEIPCFALTGPYSGSDATSIPDTGIICKRKINGKKTVGILLNWDKRYITLAPIATVIGLAFKLYDPDQILGEKQELGITCALIPANTPGVESGKRHIPLGSFFQNGPVYGKDVFIPLDYIIGGIDMAGQGWRMLVECLSCGRAISLPSSAAGKARVAYATTSAYARIRRQFNQPIGFFEGIQELLTKIASTVYISEAARKITATCIDQGEKPSIIGAIVKYQVTQRSREAAIHAMDIHAGKGIMLGPKNYIAESYINAPIGITVEGANILTRCLIVFGQGAIRCHPYIMQELQALQINNHNASLAAFDRVLIQHISYTLSNAARSLCSYLSYGKLLTVPTTHKHSKRYFQWVSWGSSCFALLSDVCLLVFGGKLKFKERLSSRLADLLSLLYLASVVLKQFTDQGNLKEELPLLEWTIRDLMSTFWSTVDEIINNMPNIWLKFILRIIVMPFGATIKKPGDVLNKKLAKCLIEPSAIRNRLLTGIYLAPDNNNPIGKLESALKQVLAAEPVEKIIKEAIKNQAIKSSSKIEDIISQSLEKSLINEQEAMLLRQAYTARNEIVAVDSFAAEKIK